MSRKLLVLIIAFAATGLLWVSSCQCIIWDGGFDLTVRVSGTAEPLRSVTCQAFGGRDEAEQTANFLLPPESDLWAARADPFAGEPLTVHVPVSGRSSMSGRELCRFQFRYLVVIGQLPDGRRVGKLVDIPDCRQSREVSVSLP